jgi:2-hydroxychromene-2-carboxylate isomerase
MWKNVSRKAALLGVELNPPASHPFNPLLALRVSSLTLPAGERSGLIDALFRAVWVRGLSVSDPRVVEGVVDEIGLPGRKLVAAAEDPEAKATLRKQTDDAIARDVFGVPTMEAGDELFWGYDDLPYLELFLAGRDPIDPVDRRRWDDPPRPSAIPKIPPPRGFRAGR